MSEAKPRRGEAGDASQPEDPGAFIGSQPELAADSIPDGPQRGDRRVAGEATQSTGPANRAANPDDGWSDAPAGHREGRAADDDVVKEKG